MLYDDNGFPYMYKSDDEVLDYVFDAAAATNGTGSSDWLSDGDTIEGASIAVTADTGLTVDSFVSINNDTAIRVWLSGGTHGTTYEVNVQASTAQGRTFERVLKIVCQKR